MYELSNLKFSQRIILNVAIMAAAMAGIVVAGYLLAERAANRSNEINAQANLKAIAGMNLNNDYSRDLVQLVSKLSIGSYPWAVGAQRLEEIKKNISVDLDALQAPPLNLDEALLLRDIKTKTLLANNFMKSLKAVIDRGDRQGLEDLRGHIYPAVDAMGFRIQLLMDYELGRSKIMMEENQISFQRSYGLLVLLALVGVYALYRWVSKHLQRTVSNPLKLLVAHMRGIARGEGNMSQRLEVIGRDEIAEVSEAFNAYLEKLQSFDEMKISLISVVSHQLKTPVAEINGYIESMLDGLTGELSEKQKDYLQDMKEIGRDNYRLISDLLSVSKIERGVLSLNVQKVSVKKVVDLSIRDYEQSIRRKGLALKIDVPEEDFLILADQDKTVETLRNLINNAIKCTDLGSITITVWNRPDQAIILVRDTGIGMNAQTMERLFTKSRALGREATRSGAGLGLYIAKHFMKLQKSEISVTSEVGTGSCFEIAIPKFKEAEREAV